MRQPWGIVGISVWLAGHFIMAGIARAGGDPGEAPESGLLALETDVAPEDAAPAPLAASHDIPGAAEGLLEQVLRTVTTHLDVIPTQAVQRAALEAALRTVDPQALLLPAGQALPGEHPLTHADASIWRQLARTPRDLLWLQLGAITGNGRHAALKDVRLAYATPAPPAGILLDLRDAGGDNLDTLDALASLLLPEGAPLYRLISPRGEVRLERVATGPSPADPPPMMILVNAGTRGAAEVLAGILRARPGVMLIGDATAGDTAFRERVSLPSEWDAWMATGWLVPVGATDPYPRGLMPDIHVASTAPPPPEPAGPPTHPDAAWNQAMATDPTLRRAADVLLALHALRAPEPPAP